MEITEEMRAEILSAFKSGEDPHVIAKRHGISYKRVFRVSSAAGLHRRRNKLSEEDELEVVRRYLADEDLAPIARDFGCSAATVKNIAKRHGCRPRPVGGPFRRYTEGEKRQMESWYDEGVSQDEIARRLGASQPNVSRYLRSTGRYGYRAGAGKNASRYKGGRVLLNGYVYVLVEADSPFASMRNSSGYIPEHRLVMAQKLGRPLARSETVHHINGDKTDNRRRNLQLRQGNHGKGIVLKCNQCGSHDIKAIKLPGG